MCTCVYDVCLGVCVCVCARAKKKSMSACVTADALSKGLHWSGRASLIRLSMTRLHLTALKMGGCLPGGRRAWFDMAKKGFLTHTDTNIWYKQHYTHFFKSADSFMWCIFRSTLFCGAILQNLVIIHTCECESLLNVHSKPTLQNIQRYNPHSPHSYIYFFIFFLMDEIENAFTRVDSLLISFF